MSRRVSARTDYPPVDVYTYENQDREQAERTAAHHRRLERYEMIGAQWASEGAGKRQREMQLAEEKRILAEAMIKEKADEEREWVSKFRWGPVRCGIARRLLLRRGRLM